MEIQFKHHTALVTFVGRWNERATVVFAEAFQCCDDDGLRWYADPADAAESAGTLMERAQDLANEIPGVRPFLSVEGLVYHHG